MKRPQDFPKALAALSVASFVLFIVPTIIGYHYLGQYATAPAFGSLADRIHIKVSFAFVMVPTLVIGVIYSNVSSKFLFQRIMGNSRHAHSNTIVGWLSWGAVVTSIWAIAFVFGNVVPSMGDFLSLMGAAFDSFYGFSFWAIAYYHLYKKSGFFTSAGRSAATLFHMLALAVGLFLLGPGLYAAVEAIIADYAGGTRPPFSCNNLTL